MVKLNVGDKFPEIKGDTTKGEVSLSNYSGKNVVVYFYPKDNTPGCTKEAKSFRDYGGEFENLNTEIVGISTDSIKSHEKFARKYDLDFTLLSDRDKTICNSCGVTGLTGMTAKRTTFLLDKEGVIRTIWENVSVKGHAEDVLNKVKELNSQ
ncbi:MAG: peroxiredoxin [Thermoplasmata archaeon]|nr:peroxiredoxin [Thermoplasmata archaeon]